MKLKDGGDLKLQLSLHHDQQFQEFLMHVTVKVLLCKTYNSDDLREILYEYAETVTWNGWRRHWPQITQSPISSTISKLFWVDRMSSEPPPFCITLWFMGKFKQFWLRLTLPVKFMPRYLEANKILVSQWMYTFMDTSCILTNVEDVDSVGRTINS
jgi:hypothetical protein